jgi:hypothetical protein
VRPRIAVREQHRRITSNPNTSVRRHSDTWLRVGDRAQPVHFENLSKPRATTVMLGRIGPLSAQSTSRAVRNRRKRARRASGAEILSERQSNARHLHTDDEAILPLFIAASTSEAVVA